MNILKTYPLLFLFVGIFSFLKAQPLTHADQMPYFPGCDHFADGTEEKRNCSNLGLVTFISNYLEYPEEARDQQIEGTVLLSFVVEADGSLSNKFVLRDIGGGCGAAALDVLQKMSRWEPGVHEGKKVAVKLNLPVQFGLKSADEQSNDAPYKIHWNIVKGKQISKTHLEAALDYPIQVRDLYGNEIPINELLFTYEKNRSFIEAKSNGRITKEMAKVGRKVRPGGLFTITATVQKDGEFVYVKKELEIVKTD